MILGWLLLAVVLALAVKWLSASDISLSHLVVRLGFCWLLLMSIFPFWRSSARTVVVVFDISASYQYLSSQQQLHQHYQQQLQKWQQKLKATDRLAVLFFAERAQIALPLAPVSGRSLPPFAIATEQTQLDIALQLTSEILADATWQQVVIYSDGNFPDTKWRTPLQQLIARGAGVSWHINSQNNQIDDLAVVGLHYPLYSLLGDSVIVEGELAATRAGSVELQLETLEQTFLQNLYLPSPGNYRFTFDVLLTQAKQKIIVAAKSQSFSEPCLLNNKQVAFVHAKNAPTVASFDSLALSLPEKWQRVVLSPEDVLQGKLQFPVIDLLLIREKAASQLHKVFPMIAEYVQNGGSLVMIGGEKSFGAGHYGGTRLEEVLPVWCHAQQSEPLALSLVLDASGSMNESWQGSSKMARAREAIFQLLNRLNSNDLLGFTAFRKQPLVTIPMGPQQQTRPAITRALNSLKAHGGTSLISTFQRLTKQLSFQPYRQHVVVVSDGGLAKEEKQELVPLVKQLKNKGISISVIATGKDTFGILHKMAQLSDGKYYHSSAENLPLFLINDVQRVRSGGLFAFSQQVREGQAIAAFPTLKKVVPSQVQRLAVTQAKQQSQVVLQTAKGLPVLSCWRFGLGKSAALTTASAPGWRGQLAYQEMLAALLHWLVPPLEEQIYIDTSSRQARLTVYSSSFASRWQVVHQKYNKQPLNPLSPNKYQGSLPIGKLGHSFWQLQKRSLEGKLLEQYPFSYFLSYPLEYRYLGSRTSSFPTSSPRPTPGTVSLKTFWCLLGAILLFLLDRFLVA